VQYLLREQFIFVISRLSQRILNIAGREVELGEGFSLVDAEEQLRIVLSKLRDHCVSLVLKFLKREILVFPVLHLVNWRAQGNNCDYYDVDQGGEDIDHPALSFRRRHRCTRSKFIGTR
jgi:hypothetical protein